MDNFAAIDFETANNERTSICSVGVVIVRNGEIADRVLQPRSSRTGLLFVLEHPYSWIDTGRYCPCSCFFGSMEAGCP